MNKLLLNKTFLITGGTGSFGTQMTKYLIKPTKLASLSVQYWFKPFMLGISYKNLNMEF